MKKILIILAALVLALVSCGEKEKTMKKEEVMSFAELAKKRPSIKRISQANLHALHNT